MNRTHVVARMASEYTRLGQGERQAIHDMAMEIMERIGIQVHDERARELLVAAGAKADGVVVRVPEYMVRRALEVAPKRMSLYDRNGRVAIRATGYNTYYGGGSDCLYVLDHRTGERRQAVMQDVVDAQIVQDALPEIDFVMSMFLPSDVDQLVYDRFQMEAMLNNTTKPIVFVAPDFQGAVAATEMAEIVAGGVEAYQRRPFATCYINVTSGLVANAEALQKCMYFAEKGLPQLYIPLSHGGVHAPCSIAAATATECAGTLLGVTLAQLVREGAPVAVPGWSGGLFNMKDMGGNYVLADAMGMTLEMGHYYGLPTFGLGGATESKVLDQQAGIEMTLGLVFQTLHGANILHDLGFMNSGMMGSLPMMAMACDVIGWIRHATAGVPINDETVDKALDLFEEVGPGGSHLVHEYTVKHFREAFYPRLIDRADYAAWERAGSTSMADRAAKMVDEILASHRPATLPADIQSDIHKIVEREQAQASSAR